MKRVIITGSNGFIGLYLAKYLKTKGYKVIKFQRKVTKTDPDSYSFLLPENIPEEPFKNADVLIHCAYQPFKPSVPNAANINIQGTKKIKELCVRYHVKFIFLSTLSAHKDAISEYGRHKLLIEESITDNSDLVLKLGLVIGERGGLYHRILKTIRKLPIIPLINGGKQPVQVLHIDDLAILMEKSIESNISGTYPVAFSKVYTMKELNQYIARQNKLQRQYITVPYFMVYAILYLAELLGVVKNISTENLKGLRQMKHFDISEENVFGVKLKGL